MTDWPKVSSKPTWRVPKDRGARDFVAALLEKMIRKHGSPLRARNGEYPWIIEFEREDGDIKTEADDDLIEVCARVLARTHRIDPMYIASRNGSVWVVDLEVTQKGKLNVLSS